MSGFEYAGDEPTLFDLKAELVLAGRFRLERRVGRGGMGDVWLARDTQLDGRRVALKVLRPEVAGDTDGVSDLKREVVVTRELRHPDIVGVYDLHDAGGVVFISMEFVDGRSLAEALALRGRRPFPLEEVLPWARQLAFALDYAHGRGVLHRDVKPGNMLLGNDGAVKLADFGIARVLKDTVTRQTGRAASGTLVYMSPQQLMDERTHRADPRNDVYSFAASLYELLSGEPPFSSGDISAQIMLKRPEPIEGVPDHVNDALLQGLAKEIGDRPANCTALVEALSREDARRAEEARKVEETRRLAEQQRLEREVEVARTRDEDARRAGEQLPGLNEGGAAKWIVGLIILVVIAVIILQQGMFEPMPAVEEVSSFGDVDVAREAGEAAGIPQDQSAALATGLRAGEARTVDLGGGVKLELVWIPPGTFQMGSKLSPDRVHATYGGMDEWKSFYEDEHPRHTVTLTRGFWLCTTEVTNRDFERFVRATNHRTDAEMVGKGWTHDLTSNQWKEMEGVSWRNPGWETKPEEPVVLVSWNDAVAYCEWLSRTTGETYRLPTEAEWEYACRAGSTTVFWWGDRAEDGKGKLNGADETKLPNGNQWEYRFPFEDGYWRKAPVGRFQANPWDLHDMLGNVWEWCHDWYGEYSGENQTDPAGPASGRYRVLRGGSWYDNPIYCRAALRGRLTPGYAYTFLGFRVAGTP